MKNIKYLLALIGMMFCKLISFSKFILLIEFAAFVSIYGCAGIWWPVHRDMYEELDSYKVHTIAVLPIRNSHLDSNETSEVNQYFMTGIKTIMKNYILISPEESLEKLERDSLSERYYNQDNIYSISNSLINEIGKSIRCDAIVMGEISGFTKHTYVDQNKIITSCGVSYRLYSAKEGKHFLGNYVESYINTDLTSGPSSLISVAKAGIIRLFLNTHN